MKLLSLTFIFGLALAVHSQNISYNSSIDLYEFQMGISNIIGNFIYFEPNNIFNISGQFSVPVPLSNCTHDGFVINLHNQIWCLGYNSSSQAYTLNLIDNQTLQVDKAVPVPIDNFQAAGIEVSGDYLIPNNITFAFVNHSVIGIFYAANPYDTKKNEFMCPGVAVNINSTNTFFPVYFTGDAFLYADASQTNLSHIYYLGCDGTMNNASSHFAAANLKIYGFNQSSVFVNLYYKDLAMNDLYMRSFSVSKHGEFTFGEELQIFDFTVVDDSTFIIPYNGGKNDTDFKTYTIDSKLNFVELKSYHSGVPGSYQEALVMSGTLNAVFTYPNNGGQFIMDLDSQDILYVAGMFPPIILQDGTIINVTQGGVFSQNHKEKHIHYTPFSWNSMYQDPTNPQHIFLMNIPNSKNSQSDVCALLEISEAGINQTIFKSCPLSISSFYNIKDVSVDNNGNLYVTYRDALNALFIVTTSKAYGPLITTTLYTYVAINVNITNGNGTFVGIQLPNSFIAGNFSTSSGQVINKATIMNGGTLNYLYKLNRQYVLLSATTGNNTVFTVWDVINNTQWYQFNSTVPIQVNTNVPFFALGVDDVSNPKTIFDGLVVTMGANLLPYLVNPDGTYVQLNLSGTFNNMNIYPFDLDSLYITASNAFLQTGVEVDVSDWGTVSDEFVSI